MRKGFDNPSLFQEVPPSLNRLGQAEVGDLCALMGLLERYTEARYQASQVIMPSYIKMLKKSYSDENRLLTH